MSSLPLITSIFMNVTNACNMECRYCFVEQHPNFMAYETAKDIADFLIRNAEEDGTVPSINFFGGEPLLCWDSVIVPLTLYIEQEYRKPFRLSMTSNCVLMTEDKLEFMKEHEIGLLFSIDGDMETQNYNRPLTGGKPSWPIVKEKIPLVLRYYPDMAFRSTLIPATCENTFHNIMFAKEAGYDNFFVIPNVFEPWSEDAKETVAQNMRQYSDYYIDCYRCGETPIQFSMYRDSFVKIQRINTAISNHECRREETCGACAKCGLGTQCFASVDFRGDVFACQEMVSPHGENSPFYIGNIYTGVHDELRKRLSESFTTAAHGDHCAQCKMARICDGGCVANNYMVTGDVNRCPPVYCWWLQLLLNEAIYISNVLGSEQNEQFIQYWTSIHDGGRYG